MRRRRRRRSRPQAAAASPDARAATGADERRLDDGCTRLLLLLRRRGLLGASSSRQTARRAPARPRGRSPRLASRARESRRPSCQLRQSLRPGLGRRRLENPRTPASHSAPPRPPRRARRALPRGLPQPALLPPFAALDSCRRRLWVRALAARDLSHRSAPPLRAAPKRHAELSSSNAAYAYAVSAAFVRPTSCARAAPALPKLHVQPDACRRHQRVIRARAGTLAARDLASPPRRPAQRTAGGSATAAQSHDHLHRC
jgi:hypothetical protein